MFARARQRGNHSLFSLSPPPTNRAIWAVKTDSYFSRTVLVPVLPTISAHDSPRDEVIFRAAEMISGRWNAL